jgi:uncharacterized membrane protein
MNKKIVISIVVSIIIVIGLLILSTGGKMGGAFLSDYKVSEDGKVMTLKVGVASSMGYIRSLKVREDDNKKYLTFYSTFGLNSKLSAKDEFQINLDPDIDEIYFFRGEEGYVRVISKNKETKEWQRVKNKGRND